MSGGVDSSVAAALLLEQGHDVTGVTLKLWGGESDSGCCSVADVEDARRVAAQLDIPHYVFNFTDDFDDAVVEPYVDEHASRPHAEPVRRVQPLDQVRPRCSSAPTRSGSTPSPPVTTRASTRGARRRRTRCDAVPTRRRTSRTCSTCSGSASSPARCFPVGELTKAEVRAHAARLGLRTATKPESMDVCFITRGGAPSVPRRAHRRRAPATSSTPRGVDVGAHDGVAAFTVGQRRGVGVAAGERRYVVDVDARTATVTHRRRARDLLRDSRRAARPHVRRRVRRSARDAASRRRARTASRSRRRSTAPPCASRRRSRASRPARWSRSTTATRSSAAASPPDRRPAAPVSDARGAASAALRSISSRRDHRDHDLGGRHRRRRRATTAAADRARPPRRSAADTEPAPAPRRRSSDAVGRGGGRSARHVADVLAEEQHRVGEGQRVDDHEPGGHEHRPATRERVERAARARTTSDRADQRARRRRARSRRRRAAAPAPRRPAIDEEARAGQRAEEQRGRDAQRDALLVAVRDRVRGGRRDVVARREHRAHDASPTSAPTIASVDACAVDRGEHRDRSRTRARSTRSAVSVDGTRRERREQPDRPRDPQQRRGRRRAARRTTSRATRPRPGPRSAAA